MKSNHLLIIAAVIVLGAWGIKVYAGTLTMNTYYPSPNGYYDTLTIRTKFFYPHYCSENPATRPPNTIYYVANIAGCVAWPFG